MNSKYVDVLKKTPQMIVSSVKLQDLSPDWIFDPQRGVIRRPDNRFYYIRGIDVTSKDESGIEVNKWKQPIVCDPGGSVTLATYDSEFVVRPKQEPGNPTDLNYALWAAGFQASEANIDQAHGGKKPANIALNKFSEPLATVGQAKDGNRFDGKVNQLSVIELDEKPTLEGDTRLVSEKVLAEMILGDRQGGVSTANEHLVETYAMYKAAETLGLL